MILDNKNAATIAEHFKNKFQVVSYAGCWDSKSITFALYQDESESAGFELTIKKPAGDYLEKVEVLKVRRLQTYGYNLKARRYERSFLPIFKA
jgi:ornithine carbamoyltransferase